MATLFNLPANVPKVTLHAAYTGPDGRPLAGWVEILAPTPLTFSGVDVFITGPVVVPLDAEGGFVITLPATDVAGSNPTDWAYLITERLAGVSDRSPYAIKLAASLVDPWLDKLAPLDPYMPNYIGVNGSAIYTGTATPPSTLGTDGDVYLQVSTVTANSVASSTLSVWRQVNFTWTKTLGSLRGSAIYTATAADPTTALGVSGDIYLRADNANLWQFRSGAWVSIGNIKGLKGDTGLTGATGLQGADSTVPGPTGPKGDKGDTGTTGQTGAQGVTGAKGDKGDPGTGAGTVTAVNGVAPDGGGNVQLVPASIGAMPSTFRGAANGVASLDGDTLIPTAQVPDLSATYVNTSTRGTASGVATLDSTGKVTSTQVTIQTAAQVGALATTTRGAANGVAPLDATSKIPVANMPELFAFKDTSTSITSSIAPANDPDLHVAVVANAKYAVEAVLVWPTGTTAPAGGFRVDFVGPTSATMVWTDNDGTGNGAIGTDSTFSETSGTTLKGMLITVGTAGTLQLRWAQSTSSTTATVLAAGCYLSARRVA